MLNKIFLKLPYFLKTKLFKIISFLTFKERYSGSFNKYLLFFQKKNDVQQIKLNSKVNVTKEVKLIYNINTPKEIVNFPIINKEILKEQLKVVDYYNKIKFKKQFTTSGTTGSAMIIPLSLSFIKYKFASSFFFKEIHHIGLNKRSANFIGRVFLKLDKKKPPFWIYSKYTNQLLFSQYHLSKSTVSFYLDAMKKYKIETFHGYPSTITILCNLIVECNLQEKAKELKIKAITLGSESLKSFQKVKIEGTFGCKVLNFYGQTESVVDIFECERGSMHINEAFSLVELIDNGDGYHRVVGTQLKNSKFPLIRYDTGDLVIYNKDEKCSCGRKSRVVNKILGRNEDCLVLKDGRKIGRLDHIFKDSINIVEAQFVQQKRGEVDLYIKKSKNYLYNDELLIKKNIIEKLGKNFNVNFFYVENIEKTNNGKLKQVINRLDE